MKLKKVYIITLVFLLVAALSFSCASKTSSTATTQQIVTVQRGTLKLDVTASGNLALSQTADLAFDVSGYVYRVLVEEGDTVKEGEVLAEVDSFDWEKEKRSLERAVVAAKVSLNNAVITLEKAQNPTTTTSTISGAISAPDPLDIETKQLQVEQAKMSLDDAEKELARYLETSPQILAPFDGFVTKVNVKGGDEIYKGAVAMSIADPAKFSVDILIGELDIDRIEVEMDAIVQLSASSASSFPAKVTKIAPTATTESGVVNYEVKVELLSAEEMQQLLISQAQANPTSSSGQPPSGEPSSGEPPSGRPPSGRPPSGETPSGQPSSQPTASSTESSGSASLTLDQLRDGLSATVTITIQEKQNILMVLNKAITRQGGKNIVQVLKGEETESRVVTTGISNIRYTEIVEGLSEGEQVVITTTTTTKSTTSQSTQGSPGGMGMGGGPPPF